MSCRHPEDVALGVVFTQEGQRAERNRRSDRTNDLRPLSPPCTQTAVGKEIPFSSPVCGGSCDLQKNRRELLCAPGKINIRVAGGKQESWFPPCASRLWKEALWAALVHSVLVSLLSPATRQQWHRRWEMLGYPRHQEGRCWCNWATSLFMLLDLWEWGEIVCPQKEVSHVAAQRPILAHFGVSHTLQNPLSPSSR